jgi:hypothetical protein
MCPGGFCNATFGGLRVGEIQITTDVYLDAFSGLYAVHIEPTDIITQETCTWFGYDFLSVDDSENKFKKCQNGVFDDLDCTNGCTFTGTTQLNGAHFGPSPSPTPTATTTAASPTPTGVTPTPTATVTPALELDGHLDIRSPREIRWWNGTRNNMARLLREATFGVMQFFMPGVNVIDIFNNAGTLQLRIRGNHLVTSGTAPGTLTAGCGTTAAIVGTDWAGFVTIGGTGITGSCGFTFNVAWSTNRPICLAGFDVNGAAVFSSLKTTSTTTTLVFANFIALTGLGANFTAGDVIGYQCVGRE